MSFVVADCNGLVDVVVVVVSGWLVRRFAALFFGMLCQTLPCLALLCFVPSRLAWLWCAVSSRRWSTREPHTTTKTTTRTTRRTRQQHDVDDTGLMCRSGVHFAGSLWRRVPIETRSYGCWILVQPIKSQKNCETEPQVHANQNRLTVAIRKFPNFSFTNGLRSGVPPTGRTSFRTFAQSSNNHTFCCTKGRYAKCIGMRLVLEDTL